jgi:hypothetical protein
VLVLSGAAVKEGKGMAHGGREVLALNRRLASRSEDGDSPNLAGALLVEALPDLLAGLTASLSNRVEECGPRVASRKRER